MTHGFDADYWEEHWREVGARDGHRQVPANPYLATGTEGLAPGTALDAGCGEGAEAIWLAERGWQVTAVDISAEVLARATERAASSPAAERIDWRRADLGRWEPLGAFDLVTTHYAHPAMPQLAFYERIAAWVAPGGTLLVVGHLQDPGGGDPGHDHAHGHGHGHGAEDGVEDGQPPAHATVTAASVVGCLDPDAWEVVSAEERSRTMEGREAPLHDVVVRARRRTSSGTATS
jgi:SAM-dependent methyltransferase